MKNSNLKVAVIGLGNIGKVVASNLVKGNREVMLADIDFTKAKDLAKSLGAFAKPSEIGEAIKIADIVIMSVYFASIKEIFTQYASELEGKIIIDPSNPIAPDEKGGFKKIIGQKESSGQILATLLPKNARLVKAFGTLGAATLEQAAFNIPRKVQFYATEDNSINTEIETLIKDNGFEPVYLGGLDKSISIEVFGDLHEFGALGKAITLEEATERI
jgi:8-hydroxy-5-deazaflavin:NADPH oxidoreductase